MSTDTLLRSTRDTARRPGAIVLVAIVLAVLVGLGGAVIGAALSGRTVVDEGYMVLWEIDGEAASWGYMVDDPADYRSGSGDRSYFLAGLDWRDTDGEWYPGTRQSLTPGGPLPECLVPGQPVPARVGSIEVKTGVSTYQQAVWLECLAD